MQRRLWSWAFVICPIACLAFPAHLLAQKVGDKVIAIRDTQAKTGDQVTGTLYWGEAPVVEDVNGDWLWIDYNGTDGVKRGWIQRRDVRSLEGGIQFFTELIRRDPTNADAYTARAIAWQQKGEFDIAIKDYGEALRLKPSAVSYYNLGNVCSEKGDYDKAIGYYDEAIRLDPSYMVAFDARGSARSKMEDYDGAITDYSRAIELNSGDTFAYRSRGDAWVKKGEYDKAVADYNEALRLNPKNGDSYGYLAFFQATCPDKRYRDGRKPWRTPSWRVS